MILKNLKNRTADNRFCTVLEKYRKLHKLTLHEFDDTIANETLTIIEAELRALWLSLESYEGMSTVSPIDNDNASTLITIEKNYDIDNLNKELKEKVPLLNIN